MNNFSIKDIEHLTGIKAHTLRIWERRYHLLLPKRKDTNHRTYNNDDLKALLRVAQLYHRGKKISHIAAMSEEEIKAATLASLGSAPFFIAYLHQLIEATLDFDQLRFERTFQNMLVHMDFDTCITQVIYPFLHRIGLLWLTDHVIPAQEHFASTLIRSKLIVATDGLNTPLHAANHYLTFLPEGELHEIPLLYINYLLKKNGKLVTNLGPDVPMEDIAYFVQQKQPTHLLTYLITQLAQPDLSAYIALVKNRSGGAQVLVLGPVAAQLRHFEGITILSSTSELETYLQHH
ncbi:MerR family transcriptional regulator [Chitinophaga costaii]|uniref:MerR family transcriptional regulator n=1 Tax=Chitinophaga costaii TaxID=1335309 RepID=UPI000F4EFD88|nr:MerR family transcriptional regulator [Chitinophaga costaii]